jgi:primosomal protein N' (replication factor Y)
MVRVDGPVEQATRNAAATLAAHARSCPEVGTRTVEVLGPAAAPIARLRGRYRFRLLLRSVERAPLRAVLRVVQRALSADKDRKIRAIIDVDPVSML